MLQARHRARRKPDGELDKLIDGFRRRRTGEAVSAQLLLLAEGMEDVAAKVEQDMAIPDQRLALMFACAHPAIEAGVRAPLMLQTVLGLDAKKIAAAFLTSPAAMGKRLGRAKEKIRQAGVPFVIPGRDELRDRLGAVLDAIYAAFTEGWTDPSGADVMRRDLNDEAIFMARLVVELLPHEPEALGLLGLLLHAESRRRARRNADGEYVPLADQDPAFWNALPIDEAETLLRRACAMNDIGRSPVVAINRALAIAELRGPNVAIEILQSLADVRFNEYQPYWAARAELLSRTAACDEARQAYEIAIGLERDPAVRAFLRKRQASLAH